MESQSDHSFELKILGHALLLENLEGMDTVLLVLREQIENGYTFILALLVDTFKALNIESTTGSPYLECYASLFTKLVSRTHYSMSIARD